MPPKSKITRLAPEHRAYIERLLREDRLTLDEMQADLAATFPDASSPSRSSLGRYKASFEVMAGRMRDIQEASKVLVAELGEDINDRGGQLLVEAITTLATDAALKAQDADGGVTIKEVGELARGARAVLQARTASLREREAIKKAGQEELLRAQQKKLGDLEKSGAISKETLARVMEAAYGLTV